jgi:hypothetical protein
MALKWEYVGENTFRARVHGGWLYRYGTFDNGSMVFVPYTGES